MFCVVIRLNNYFILFRQAVKIGDVFKSWVAEETVAVETHVAVRQTAASERGL